MRLCQISVFVEQADERRPVPAGFSCVEGRLSANQRRRCGSRTGKPWRRWRHLNQQQSDPNKRVEGTHQDGRTKEQKMPVGAGPAATRRSS